MLQTFLFLFFLFILLIFVRAEGAIRQAVDPDHLLVGVLEDEVLALIQLHADVNDASQDAPGVLYAQVNLAGKLIWLELLRAQDHVAGRVLHMVTGHIPGEGEKKPAGYQNLKLGQQKKDTKKSSMIILVLCYGMKSPNSPNTESHKDLLATSCLLVTYLPSFYHPNSDGVVQKIQKNYSRRLNSAAP